MTNRPVSAQQSHAHHYVPEWLQKRFLPPGQVELYYLDLKPAIAAVTPDGVEHRHRSLFRRAPKRCFYRDDLYMLRFGSVTTDLMESFFFGSIDTYGCRAVRLFADYQELSDRVVVTFRPLVAYMGAQRFRTPRGLDDIQKRHGASGHQNATLAALRDEFQAYGTMWTEGVWEIVRATRSPTKFIVTDDPVTFYCSSVFPSEWEYPNDVSLKQIGTRTIFPLGLDSCLIITHLQHVRNPWSVPTEFRENARFYGQTMKHLGDIQFGRELEEDEVMRINYILKRRATRYIAAAEEEWLHPERHASVTEWARLDHDWFLLPHLWRVHFTVGIMAGGGKRPPFAMDEYGLRPWQRGFEDARRREREWETFERAKHEWAKKRVGKSWARDHHFGGRDVSDEMAQGYLRDEGLLPPISSPQSPPAS